MLQTYMQIEGTVRGGEGLISLWAYKEVRKEVVVRMGQIR
jgi:hypothetical protein